MQVDHLLCVPDPYDNESINGFIQRVALENRYENANWIYSLKKISLNLKTRVGIENDILKLSELLNKDYLKLYALTYFHIFSKNNDWLPVLIRQGINRHSKYCPKCFKENGYHNKFWDISFNIFCSKHNLLLIDMCPKCKKFISSNLKNMNTCLCGFPIHELPHLHIPIEYSRMGSFLEGIFTKEKHTKGCLINLTAEEFTYILLFIVNQLYFERYGEQAKVSSSFIHSNGFIEVIVDSIRIFTSWPTSFYEFLDNYGKSVKRKDRKTGITTYFGKFYMKLYSQFNDPCFDFIKNEFENYIKSNFNKGYFNRYNNFEAAEGETKYVSGNNASKILKVNHDTIAKLIDDGLIKGIREIVGKQEFLNVDYDSLQDYKKIRESHIALPEVVSILGVNRFLVLKLYDMGVISGFEKKKTKTTMQILFDKKSVLDLLQKFDHVLKNSDVEMTNQKNKIINFNGCIHSWGCMQKSSNELVEKILSGKLRPIGKGKGIGLQCYLFYKKDLEKIIEEDLILTPKDTYSIKEAMLILKTNNKVMDHWIKEGIIKFNKINSKKVLIDREELEIFRGKYITLPEIAKVLNQNSTQLINRIKRMDIEIVVASTANSGGYLFYRDEINRKLILPEINS